MSEREERQVATRDMYEALARENERLREDRDRILARSDERWRKLDTAMAENKRLREAWATCEPVIAGVLLNQLGVAALYDVRERMALALRTESQP